MMIVVARLVWIDYPEYSSQWLVDHLIACRFLGFKMPAMFVGIK